MSEREITSRDNPAVKRYVQLASSRRARREQGCFVTEGFKLAVEAFRAGYTPEMMFVTEEAFDHGYEGLDEVLLASEKFYRINGIVADKLAQSVSPQGVFGLFRMLDNGTQPVKIGSNGKFLLLSSLQDPGNLGTILRTAAAFGINGVILSDDCPDLYSLKVLRAAMGGVFKLPLLVTQDLGTEIDRLRENGICVYAAALSKDAVSVRDANLGKGSAIVIGNEGSGLSQQLIDRCDVRLLIPMEPGNESLNAATAAGILLWEMYR